MSDHSKVMGPDAQTTQNSVLTPPKLNSQTDKYQWRTDVKTWTRIIKQYARGGDTRAKGLLSALALTLYFSLDRDQRNIIDNAVSCKQISLEFDDDADESEKLSLAATAREQFKLVEEIVQLVAKDTPTDGIRRLVKTSQEIYHCTRGKSEQPHIFARRFQGLAKSYLTMCSPPQGVQESQNFAILLLENAKLPSSTFNNIVTQLVTKSSNTPTDATDSTVVVQQRIFTDMLERTAEVGGAIKAWETSVGITAHDEVTQELINRTRSMITSVRKTALDIRKSCEPTATSGRMEYTIRLDDAVDALCDMKADEEIATKPTESETPKQGTMMMKRKYDKDEERQQFAKKTRLYIPAGTGIKKNSICNSCKKQGHWMGDYECENHSMHHLWLEKKAKKTEEGDEKQIKFNTSKTYFQ